MSEMRRIKLRKVAVAAVALVAAILAAKGISSGARRVRGWHNRRVYYERSLAKPSSLPPPTYYISPSGDDSRAGTSPQTAWRGVSRANEFHFSPGSTILFEGGKSFSGGLRLDADDTGTASWPITISSYGNGRATILAGDGDGIYVHNTGGVVISNLNIVGSGRTTNKGDGIYFNNDLDGDVKIDLIRIEQVEASGFGNYGIRIDSNNGKSGYRDVRIARAVAHDNSLGGIYVFGEYSIASSGYAHEDVYVGYSKAFNNPGIAGEYLEHSGNGIVLSDVNRGTIEHSVAHDNGWLCNSRNGGPVGIWAWDSNWITIQHNESYRNRVAGPKDGGGFDLDGAVTNSVLQYNYSHDNDGGGYFLAQFQYARTFRNNTVRYNISENDGRKNDYGGILVWGPVEDSQVYNNTVFLSPAPQGSPAAVRFRSDRTTTRNVRFSNNLLQTTGGLPLVVVPTVQNGLEFEGNAYFSSGADFRIEWLGATYASLAAWRSATGQERRASEAPGLSVDPKLRAPGGGRVLDDAGSLHTLDAYRLQAGSPLIDAGLDLKRLFGWDPGHQDYFGNAIPQLGGFDIGAHEYEGAASSRAR